MAKEYSKEQLWKLFEKLPQELKEAVFSEETAENISEICARNKIEESEKISSVAKYTGRVLVGLLPPTDFQETLEKEVKLAKERAKRVAQEINRFIFYPVKSSLEKIHEVEITAPAKPLKATPRPEEKPPALPKEAKEDVYRESVE